MYFILTEDSAEPVTGSGISVLQSVSVSANCAYLVCGLAGFLSGWAHGVQEVQLYTSVPSSWAKNRASTTLLSFESLLVKPM